MDEHSPLPWRRGHYAGTAGIDDANGSSVADAVDDADAELILRAVNAHAELLAACRHVIECEEHREEIDYRFVREAYAKARGA
jgi:hypothetical protein